MANLSRKGAKTRQQILNSAFDLFHEHGIHATSVDDILKRSGAGKSQFYHYFKSKEDILHVLLQGIHTMIKEGQTHFKPMHSWEDFQNWLSRCIDKQKEHDCARACPIGQMAGQLSQDDKLLREDIKNIFQAMKDYPKAFFEKLKANAELVEAADPDAMADMCVAAMQGGAMLAKTYRNEKAARNAADQLYAHMRSFLK